MDPEPEYMRGEFDRGYDYRAWESSKDLVITSGYVYGFSIYNVVSLSLMITCGLFAYRENKKNKDQANQTTPVTPMGEGPSLDINDSVFAASLGIQQAMTSDETLTGCQKNQRVHEAADKTNVCRRSDYSVPLSVYQIAEPTKQRWRDDGISNHPIMSAWSSNHYL
jgi:hypothetical protein